MWPIEVCNISLSVTLIFSVFYAKKKRQRDWNNKYVSRFIILISFEISTPDQRDREPHFVSRNFLEFRIGSNYPKPKYIYLICILGREEKRKEIHHLCPCIYSRPTCTVVSVSCEALSFGVEWKKKGIPWDNEACSWNSFLHTNHFLFYFKTISKKLVLNILNTFYGCCMENKETNTMLNVTLVVNI